MTDPEKVLEFKRICTKCLCEKNFSEFGSKNHRGKPLLHSVCRDCRLAATKAYCNAHREELKTKKRNKRKQTDPIILREQKRKWLFSANNKIRTAPFSMVCTKCKKEKPSDLFYNKSSAKDGKNPQCKMCCADSQVKWRSANREKLLKSKLNTYKKKKYGLTNDMFHALLVAQDGRCAVCKCVLDGSRFSLKGHIDHCHSNGGVRGILCGSCNTGIGLLKDDPKVILEAFLYLAKYKENR